MDLTLYGWAELLAEENSVLVIVSESDAELLVVELRFRVAEPAEMIVVIIGDPE